MNEAPVGIFDSGFGGLTAVRELRGLLPGEDIVYFGDTGRVPYGTRGRDIIIAYAKQDVAFLLSQNVKAILAACGTVSSTVPSNETQKLPVPYMGVVPATTLAAVKATKTGRVGIIGTEATIASGSYESALKALAPDIRFASAACPLFVPLVENGRVALGDPLSTIAAHEYLAPIKTFGADTLILGCTHYPLLSAIIAQEMGPSVTLINSGRETALCIKNLLAEKDMLADKPSGGATRYYVSDDPSRFHTLSQIFLGGVADGPVEKIDIENCRLRI